AVVSICRGSAVAVGKTLFVRFTQGRRPRVELPTGWFYLWHRWSRRAYLRRFARWVCDFPFWPETPALANDPRDVCPECCVHFPRGDPVGKFNRDRQCAGGGAIWLRLRVQRLYGLYDDGRRGGAQDGPLCDLHGIHGLGDDGARHGGWMAAGPLGVR